MGSARPGARETPAGDGGAGTEAAGHTVTVREPDGTEITLTFRAGDKVRAADERALLEHGGNHEVTHGEIVAVEPEHADALVLRWADARGPFRWTVRVNAAAVRPPGDAARAQGRAPGRQGEQAPGQAAETAAAKAAAAGDPVREPFPGRAGGPPPGTPCPACGSPLYDCGPLDGREAESGVSFGHEGFGDTYLCEAPGTAAHWWAGLNGALVPPEHVLTVVEADPARPAARRRDARDAACRADPGPGDGPEPG